MSEHHFKTTGSKDLTMGLAGMTRLELAASALTGQRSNHAELSHH